MFASAAEEDRVFDKLKPKGTAFKLFEKTRDGEKGALLREYNPPVCPEFPSRAGMTQEGRKRALTDHLEQMRLYRAKLEPDR